MTQKSKDSYFINFVKSTFFWHCLSENFVIIFRTREETDLAAAIAVAVLIRVPASSWRAALKQRDLKTKGRLLQPELYTNLEDLVQE